MSLNQFRLLYIWQSIEWRQINQVDEIVDNWNPPEILRKYYAFGSPGYDKFDCPGQSHDLSLNLREY